jgi:hypothetical protein
LVADCGDENRSSGAYFRHTHKSEQVEVKSKERGHRKQRTRRAKEKRGSLPAADQAVRMTPCTAPTLREPNMSREREGEKVLFFHIFKTRKSTG